MSEPLSLLFASACYCSLANVYACVSNKFADSPQRLADASTQALQLKRYDRGGKLSHSTRRKSALLQVVPILFFEILDTVIAIHQAHSLRLPDRLEKAQLREYAQFPERAELAKALQRVASYARNLHAFDR